MKPPRSVPVARVAVAAPFPDIVRIHEAIAEYADELEVCAMISSPDAVLEQARLLQPDVLLLSDELGPNRGDTLARLTALAPATRLVMLVGRHVGAEPLIADGVVALDAPADELRAAIVATMTGPASTPAPAAHGRVPFAPALALPGADVATGADAQPEPGGSEADAPRPQPEPQAARTVLVFSGKGGVGKSIVATNLATALSQHGGRVALVDLNLQYGDVGLLLHLEGHPVTIETLARREGAIDAALLDQTLARSEHGVRVLLAPTSPEASDLVTAAMVEVIITQLRAGFDYVVVDAPSHLEERVVGVMEVADQILLVSSSGITSIKDTKVTLRLLQSLGVQRDRVALVVNQATPRIGFAAEELERALHFPILSNLPYEARMDESLHGGRPMVVTEPRSAFSRQLALVAEHVSRAREGASTEARAGAVRWRLRFGR